jgi:type IV pilus assembly protein PilF
MDLGAQALWLGVRVERRLGDRDAEASYGAQLRRRFPESMQAQWLVTGQYEQAGSLL